MGHNSYQTLVRTLRWSLDMLHSTSGNKQIVRELYKNPSQRQSTCSQTFTDCRRSAFSLCSRFWRCSLYISSLGFTVLLDQPRMCLFRTKSSVLMVLIDRMWIHTCYLKYNISKKLVSTVLAGGVQNAPTFPGPVIAGKKVSLCSIFSERCSGLTNTVDRVIHSHWMLWTSLMTRRCSPVPALCVLAYLQGHCYSLTEIFSLKALAWNFPERNSLGWRPSRSHPVSNCTWPLI